MQIKSSHQKNVKSGVSALSSTSSSFGTAASSAKYESHSNGNGIDESLKAQVLAEEEAAMNQYKVSPNFTPTTQNFLTNFLEFLFRSRSLDRPQMPATTRSSHRHRHRRAISSICSELLTPVPHHSSRPTPSTTFCS